MAYSTIQTETHGAVLLIKLDRPKAMNALNSELLSELAAALEAADADKKVRAIVLTGSEKAFAAGADVKEMSNKSYADMVNERLFAEDASVIDATRKPVIAAVSGYALGGGCELAMMCDFIIAADNAKFGQPEITLGVIPGLGGTQRLARFVGKSKAMEMILTGRFMDAEEAERSGLVSRVVPCAKLLDDALATAEKIADMSLISAAAAKEAVKRAYETPLSEGLLFEQRSFHGLFATEDQKEGMLAFVEKRTPQFRDK